MNVGVRRAVIFDGRVCEKKDHPECKEIPEVSGLLELERERRGELSIPRYTTQLLEQTIRKNDPVFWKAVVSDIDTGDFDGHSAQVILEQIDILPALLVTCVIEAKETEHFVNVLRTFVEISPHLNDATTSLFTKAISIQWKAFVNALIANDRIDRTVKEGVYECISRFVSAVDIQQEALVMCVREILKNKKFEILSIFSRVSSKIYADGIVEELLQAVKSTTATNRYAVVCLLAKIIAEVDDVSTDVAPAIQVILEKTMLDKFVDRRTVRSLAFILQKTAKDPVLKNFATAVNWMVSKKD
ncbi:hypothetical protein ATCVMO0605SPH_162R [Acanthocystis turfacea Chlorella virus MO0605SPH]|nr:hypothetical protein ATCVMO0605SPH_162R [Acanthocystis turfacea Chlorella virus MO0605SPH]